MQTLTLVLCACVLATALAAGQYYVPRAYYTIDGEGHPSASVPLRRLRRSPNMPPPLRPSGASANANANANAWSNGSGGSSASANANANAGSGSWYPGGGSAVTFPGGAWAGSGAYGASNPALISSGAPVSFGYSGPVSVPAGGGGVSVSSSAGLDSSGRGYYGTQTGFYPSQG